MSLRRPLALLALLQLAGCYGLSTEPPWRAPFCDAQNDCAVGAAAVDLDGNRCADRCEVAACETFAPVDCGAELPVDLDGDGCARECPPVSTGSCGGLGGGACDPGAYCDYALDAQCGAADQTGTCRPTPGACTEQYAPVCGCDGRTYGNECTAHGAGVAVLHWGACATSECMVAILCSPGTTPVDTDGDGCDDGCLGVQCPAIAVDCGPDMPVDLDGDGCALECPAGTPTSCGGLTPNGSPTCAAGMFCDYQPGATCGWADAPGTCRVPPTVCTREYAPVCGCDGNTYGNDCEAAANSVGVLHEGACPTVCDHPIDCVDPNAQPVDTDGDGCADACREVCGGFAGFACDAGEVCFFPTNTQCGNADHFGFCEVPPTFCTDHIELVCGCDGRTYGNPCEARAAGVSLLHPGACNVICPLLYPDCGPGTMPADTNGDGCVDGCL